MIITLPNAENLAETVAKEWLDMVTAAESQQVPHTVALSGGRITIKFFASVIAQNRTRGISFAHVHFFWADERCVPPTDVESNFRAANELLFGPLNISASQIHRLKGEEEPETAAQAASEEIRRFTPTNSTGQPVLDLVLLGMGEDGHVASLFPGASPEVVNCTTPFLVIRNSPKPPPTRISLSYATITSAKATWVLASGVGKEKALQDSLLGDNLTPLGHVIRSRPDTKVFTELKVVPPPSV